MSNTDNISEAPESIVTSSSSSLEDKSKFSATHIKLLGGLLVVLGGISLYNVSMAISDDKGKTERQRINYCRIVTNSGIVLLGGWLVAKPDQWNKPHIKWVFGGLFILDFILYMVKQNIKH
jgi:hypothetical protein